jgi:bifunctional DNase/RNase
VSEATFVEVNIENVSLSKLGFIVFLRREGADSVLPICIGAAEAHSIAAAYNNRSFPRPLSHDLFKNVLDTLECTVNKVHVTDLVDGTFYARIFISQGGREYDIDSRPSDAIALALRFAVPIWVSEHVLESAAIDIDLVEGGSSSKAPPEPPKALDPIERLQQELADAVRKEQYERAAELRDELQKLQAGN